MICKDMMECPIVAPDDPEKLYMGNFVDSCYEGISTDERISGYNILMCAKYCATTKSRSCCFFCAIIHFGHCTTARDIIKDREARVAKYKQWQMMRRMSDR